MTEALTHTSTCAGPTDGAATPWDLVLPESTSCTTCLTGISHLASRTREWRASSVHRPPPPLPARKRTWRRPGGHRAAFQLTLAPQLPSFDTAPALLRDEAWQTSSPRHPRPRRERRTRRRLPSPVFRQPSK